MVELLPAFRYNLYEERILKTLSLAYRILTTRQIAAFSGISYNTVKNYLNKFKKPLINLLTKLLSESSCG